MSNFLDDLAREAQAVDLEVVPTEEGSARLRKAALEMYETERAIAELEKQVKDKKARLTELSQRTVPDIMAEIGQDTIGLPDAGEHGVDIISSPYYHANISKDWEEDRRQAAFALLERKGAGDLIRNLITLSFTRGEHDKVQVFLATLDDERFEELMREHAAEMDVRINDFSLPAPAVELTVPWNTLTAYVKEQHIAGTLHELWMQEEEPPIDPVDTLGATIGVVAKIKPRKAKK